MLHRYDVYVTKLEGGKYYIQKSKTVMESYEMERTGRGCKWTRQYKPIRMLAIYGDCVQETIDSFMAYLIKTYIKKYGLANVRGGPFTTEKIDKDELHEFMKERNCIVCYFKACTCKEGDYEE